MNGIKPLDCHHFNALVQLGTDTKTQAYVVEVSLNQKTVSYIVKEKVVQSIPFIHVVRLSSSSSSLTLHVKGERLGEIQALIHIVNDEDVAPLTAFLSAHCLNDSNLSEYEHILSPFDSLLNVIHAGPVTKKGFWGGDANRFALLVPHRLLLYRTQAATYPLTVLMMTDIANMERKGRRRIRLSGSEREWELGFDDESAREEFYSRLETEKLESGMRVIAWKRKRQMLKKAAEDEESKRAEVSHSRSHSVSPYDQSVNQSFNQTMPTSPGPFSVAAASMHKRRSMPSPAPVQPISQNVLAAKAKRSSLTIRTTSQAIGRPNQAPFSPMSTLSPSFSHMSINQHSPSFTSSVANYRGDEQVSPFPYSPRINSANSPNLMLRSPSHAGPSPRLSPSLMSARYSPHPTSPIPPVSPISNPPHRTPCYSTTIQLNSNGYTESKSLSPRASNGCWKFTVFVRGFDEPLGQITFEIDPSLTLAHLRQAIIDELDDVPDEFQFTEDDALTGVVVPISTKQEKNRSLETVPQGPIFIRVKQVRGSLSDNSKDQTLMQHNSDKYEGDYTDTDIRKSSLSFASFSTISEGEVEKA